MLVAENLLDRSKLTLSYHLLSDFKFVSHVAFSMQDKVSPSYGQLSKVSE
ncbi:hypothetical protein YSA_10946 [Pseudomonas putida ND6]|uniref:Uncharacterized protein n=1 Tax=Pseudomonas putida ND6 TaxID=231023 RepID=I3V4N5_PSEPU|nr:hypothetical protein YSA_10946 [Pseudomonas putida ND6]